jgi:hypothetical protein
MTNSAREVGNLDALAQLRFEGWTEAERRFLSAAQRGEQAICSAGLNSADSFPSKFESWGRQRSVRAELIRWLCADEEASKAIDPRGLRLYAAKVVGELDLSYLSLRFPLELSHCAVTSPIDLRYITAPSLNFEGTGLVLNLEGGNVGGSVTLNSIYGEVHLDGSRIGNDLRCIDAQCQIILGNGPAFSATQADIKGNVLINGLLVKGAVDFRGIRIGGQFSAVRATLENLRGTALNLDHAEIGKSVYFRDGFTAKGEVHMFGAQVGGNLRCEGALVLNENCITLGLENARIEGDVHLDRDDREDASGPIFSSEGTVDLRGAKIGGVLYCSDGSFRGGNHDAVSADGIEVKDSIFLARNFSAVGPVRLVGAKVEGTIECGGGSFTSLNLDTANVKGVFFWQRIRDAHHVTLNLNNASVSSFADDEQSWPARGNLLLDGFVYGHFYKGPKDTTPKDARARLRWLDLQQTFAPQPYRQLAKALREMGDQDGAKQVLFELERRARAEDRSRLTHWPRRLLRAGEDLASGSAVGYGIYPGWALSYLCGLAALGWIVHRRADRIGAMAPTEKDAYAQFHEGKTPHHYQPFNALIYSIEKCLPLVKLGQDERWQPDAHPHRRTHPMAKGRFRRAVDSSLDLIVPAKVLTPSLLRWLRWFMIGLGWLLATFFVAGLTGIVRVD